MAIPFIRRYILMVLVIATPFAWTNVSPHIADARNPALADAHSGPPRYMRAVAALPQTAITRTLFLPLMSYQLPPSRFGVEMVPISDAGGLTRLAQAGATWVRRAAVWWPDIEGTKGVRNWSSLSGMQTEFANASAKKMQLILVVRGTPSWAQQLPPSSCGPIKPENLADFADFMAALVARYSGPPYNVKYWELGNEPDVDPGLVAPDSLFGCWGNNADPYYGGGYYAQMLKVVYPRMKTIDPAAQVLVGGLLLDCDPRLATYGCSLGNPKPALFLEGVLRNGGGAYFDGVAFHAYDKSDRQLGVYNNPNWHSDTKTGPISNIKASFIRSVLSAYGVNGKYLINTEAALLCVECDNDPNYEMTKAYYVAQLFSASIVADLRAATWYRVFGWPRRSTALLNPDLSARPAYTAFQVISSMMAGVSYSGEITTTDIGGSTNVRGYKFVRRDQGTDQGTDQRTWVVWSTDAATHTLQLASAPQSVRDVFGNALVFANPTKIDLIPANRLLVYLTWTH